MIKIWIGRRETDVITYKPVFFDYTITYYGSNQFPNFSYAIKNRKYVNYNDDFYNFIINCLENKLQISDKFELYFYNCRISKKLAIIRPDWKRNFKNCNPYDLLDLLNNKTYTRLWLSNLVHVPPFALLSKSECIYKNLIHKFKPYQQFIIQYNYSSGGDGTFLMNATNEKCIRNKLSLYKPYLVSPYIEDAYSLCCHVVIGKNKNIVFPIGLQILSKEMNYNGTTYILPIEIKEKLEMIYAFIENISTTLARVGYRGICGYDFLVNNNDIFLIEINPRYMGSSYLINKVLFENNLPSLFELNNNAFQNKTINWNNYQEKISKLQIRYTSYIMFYKGKKSITELPIYDEIYSDGYNLASSYDSDVYLYSYLVNNK